MLLFSGALEGDPDLHPSHVRLTNKVESGRHNHNRSFSGGVLMRLPSPFATHWPSVSLMIVSEEDWMSSMFLPQLKSLTEVVNIPESCQISLSRKSMP